MQKEIMLVELPKPHDDILGCWYNGFPVHKGHTEQSLNYATAVAHQLGVVADQKLIQREWDQMVATLKAAGFQLTILPFPEELNRSPKLDHDAVFIRDAGIMFRNFWVQSRFSVPERVAEADVYAKIVAERFNKKIIELPEGAYLEGGEVFYLETAEGSFYFGGLSRSNRQAHDFVRSVINPDYFCVLDSDGYHLDTVFTPVIDALNNICAFLVSEDMLSAESLETIRSFNKEIIFVDPRDAAGKWTTLGSFALNALIAPGIMVSGGYFLTEGVEERLAELGIKRFVTPLSQFRWAGGSVHCLTNEIREL